MSAVIAHLQCCAPARFSCPARLAGHLFTEHHVPQEHAIDAARKAFARARPRPPASPILVQPATVEPPPAPKRRRVVVSAGRFATTVAAAKRAIVTEALRKHQGRRDLAASWLGITRGYLFRLMTDLGIDVPCARERG